MYRSTTQLVSMVGRTTRRSAAAATGSPVKREISPEFKDELDQTTPRPRKARKIEPTSPISTPAKVKAEPTLNDGTPSKTTASSRTLQERKAAAFSKYASSSPFPNFAHPTPEECSLARQILEAQHGPKKRPKEVKASADRAGCGDSPNVLDALVRTILSQNTSDTNSSRAKRSMDAAYGRSDDWEAIVKGGQAQLEEAIRCGGLSQVKSKVIIRILEQTKDKYGSYNLDHLQAASAEDAMAELLGFDGVGPKTASCVLLFCLGKEDFAVDTHVHRITGLLGWRPTKSSREQTYHHLNKKIPDEHKYALHILLVSHGKRCDECKAGGRNAGQCELRKAFRQKAKAGALDGEDEEMKEVKGEPGHDVKNEVSGGDEEESKEEAEEDMREVKTET